MRRRGESRCKTLVILRQVETLVNFGGA
jgi:hypothetical protein